MNSELPESAYQRCLACGKPVRPTASMLYEITGFERERQQGGTNHVVARKRTGRIVGSCCALRIQAGIPAEQETLL